MSARYEKETTLKISGLQKRVEICERMLSVESFPFMRRAYQLRILNLEADIRKQTKLFNQELKRQQSERSNRSAFNNRIEA